MDKKYNSITIKGLILLPFLAASLDSGAAGLASVLDPTQHPGSPQYDSVFNQDMLPLDAALSWKNRFNGDETFNSEQIIAQKNAPAMTKPATTSTGKPGSVESVNTDAVGVIKDLRLNQAKVKIAHGPIEKYGMPAMSMMFKVSDPSMLEGLKKNQKIGFNVDNNSAGFVVSRIIPMAQMENSADKKSQLKMDARGVVQAVRIEQGKIKIKHGPIEKFGMPSMTMLFKVSEPALLTGLQKGTSIDFEIDNASGGFVITNIVPVTQITAVAPVTEDTPNIRLCYMTGPFKQKTRALELNSRYAANNIETEMKSSAENVYLGIMVYIAGHKNRQDAKNTVDALVQHGIDDYFIIDEPGKSNVLSLGVFGSKEYAESRIAEIEALNFQVESEPRYRRQTQFWLYTKHSNESNFNSLLDPADIEKGISQVPRQCA